MCQLQSMPRVELETFTKAQLIQLALVGVVTTEITEREVNTDHGALIKIQYVYRDAYTQVIIGKKLVTWDFYPTGEIQDIITTERNASDVVWNKWKIHHFTNGRSPVQIWQIKDGVTL